MPFIRWSLRPFQGQILFELWNLFFLSVLLMLSWSFWKSHGHFETQIRHLEGQKIAFLVYEGSLDSSKLASFQKVLDGWHLTLRPSFAHQKLSHPIQKNEILWNIYDAQAVWSGIQKSRPHLMKSLSPSLIWNQTMIQIQGNFSPALLLALEKVPGVESAEMSKSPFEQELAYFKETKKLLKAMFGIFLMASLYHLYWLGFSHWKLFENDLKVLTLLGWSDFQKSVLLLSSQIPSSAMISLWIALGFKFLVSQGHILSKWFGQERLLPMHPLVVFFAIFFLTHSLLFLVGWICQRLRADQKVKMPELFLDLPPQENFRHA